MKTTAVLWSRGNIVASHLAGPGSIPVRVSLPGFGFFPGFSTTLRQISENLGPIHLRISLAITKHKKSFHMGALKPILSAYFAQEQVFHCKLRQQGRSSAQR